MRRRLKDESGIALVMAIGILTVLMIAGTAVVFYAGSNARSSEHSADTAKAVNLGEAGMNYARAILWNSGTPNAASAVHSCSSLPLPSLTLEGGTVTYCGTYDSGTQTWTLQGTGTYTNPTGGTEPVSRTVSSQVQVTTTTAFEAAWGYLFADTTSQCTLLKNNLTIDAPVYVRGDLCMENSALINSELVRVRGKVDIKDSASIGTVADTVDQVDVGGGCRYGGSGAYDPNCPAATKVYRVNFSSSPPNILKPTVDLNYWYLNAKPGPKAGCTTGSFPGAFDNDGGTQPLPNRSNGTQYLFSSTAYDCKVMAGATQLGRIAYAPGNPGTLIVDGVVFFDGKLELPGNRDVVYQGRGSIYATDVITIQNYVRLCADAGCNSATWNPDTNLLAFVAGATADDGFVIENNTTFQGAVYVVNDYVQKNDVSMCGPVIAQELKIDNHSTNCYVPFSSLAPGMPGSTGVSVVTLTNVPNSFTTS